MKNVDASERGLKFSPWKILSWCANPLAPLDFDYFDDVMSWYKIRLTKVKSKPESVGWFIRIQKPMAHFSLKPGYDVYIRHVAGLVRHNYRGQLITPILRKHGLCFCNLGNC